MKDAQDLKCTCCGQVGTMREFIKVGDELVLLKDGATSKDNYRRYVCLKCSHVDFYWSCVNETLEKERQVSLYEKFVIDINDRISKTFLPIAEKIKARFLFVYNRTKDASMKEKMEAINEEIITLKNIMIYIGPFSVIDGKLEIRGAKGIEAKLYKSVSKDISLEYDDELKALCDYILSFKEAKAEELYRVNALKRYKASGYDFDIENSFYRLMNFKFVYMMVSIQNRLIELISFRSDDKILTEFDKKYFDEIKKEINKIEMPEI